MRESLEKSRIKELAIFGGSRLFHSPKPTSNLVRPSLDRFLQYLEINSSGAELTLTEMLESRLADLHETQYCVAMNSGFWALALLIDALRIEGRVEVIIPSLTYRRMADIISWCGLTPCFCDIEISTLANSANTVRPCINKNTALIIGVHPVGGHCDVIGLEQLANEYSIPVIFDSVESVHERHQGKRVGSFGSAELFSLGASKLINGFEGGYVTTNSQTLAEKLRLKRTGKGPGLTISARMPLFHAAMGLAGLDELQEQLMRNQARFDLYLDELVKIPSLRLVQQPLHLEPSHKNIVIEVLESWPFTRDETVALLNSENILARAYYAPPLTHRPIRYAYVSSALPNTDWVAERFISMPCGHLVSLDDIKKITKFLGFLSENSIVIKQKLKNYNGVN